MQKQAIRQVRPSALALVDRLEGTSARVAASSTASLGTVPSGHLPCFFTKDFLYPEEEQSEKISG